MNEEKYEIEGDKSVLSLIPYSPKRSRLNPKKLFDGFVFYLIGDYTSKTLPSVSELYELIELGGGKYVKNVNELIKIESDKKYCIFSINGYDVIRSLPSDIKVLSIRWLLDSISNYEILDEGMYSNSYK